MYGSAEDVVAFLGEPEDGCNWTQIETVLATAKAMVQGFTRGRGFNQLDEPNGEIAAVIVSCAARLYRNPTLDRGQTTGPFAQQPGIFAGWTLAELAILHNYRVRAW